MKTKKSTLSDFIENQLTVTGQQSIWGGLPPGGTVPVEVFEDDPIDPNGPQNGGPNTSVLTPTIKGSDPLPGTVIIP